MKQEEAQDLTLAEFAKAARVTYHTARDWAIKGIIPSYRIGRVIRIPAGTFEKIRAEGIKRASETAAKQ